MRFKFGAFIVFAVCSALAAPAFLHAGTWSRDQSIEHDGLTRRFIYFLPTDLPPDSPVLIWLHMGGGSCWEIRDADYGGRKDFPVIAEREKFLLISPNGCAPGGGDPSGRSQHWNDCRANASEAETFVDDVGFIAALIDWAAASFDIDPKRIYVAGLSNGGMMAYRLALELADRIAAASVFCANMSENSECTPMNKPISVFICNGQGEDRYMPWDGGCINSTECERDEVVSAISTRDWWIDYNSCTTEPITVTYEDADSGDRSTVTSDLFSGGENGTAVKFYTVWNGGHLIPTLEHPYPPDLLEESGFGNQNRDIIGAEHAWEFMRQFSLQTETPDPEPNPDPPEDPPEPDLPEPDSPEPEPARNSSGGGGGCMIGTLLSVGF